jgi:Na+/H+ antiporter NhaB
MNNTFDFEKEFPELYAEVQANKAKEKRAERLAVLISIAVNLLIASVLHNHDVGIVSHLLIIGWTSFTSIFTLRPLLEQVLS